MGVIASWGSKKFEVTTNRIYPFNDFSTAFKLKTDANSDTSGTTPTNTRGRELEEIKMSTRCLAAAGVSVRKEMGSWRKLVGETHPMMIGGVSFGAGEFQLESVDVSETQLDTHGNFLAATLSFTFREFTTSQKAATAKATQSTSKSSSNHKTEKSKKVEKKTAMISKPSKSDKAKKSTIPISPMAIALYGMDVTLSHLTNN